MSEEIKKCPICQEEIDKNTETCPHCGEKLMKTCPYCGEKIKAIAVKCKYCKKFLEDKNNKENNEVQKEINEDENDNSMLLGIIILISILCLCLFLIVFNKRQNNSNKQDEFVSTQQEPQKFDTYVGEISYADLIGQWSPPDRFARNPHLFVEYASNKNLSFTISWSNGFDTGSRTKLLCKNEGINALTLYCDGKKYEYYPVRNGQRIDSSAMEGDAIKEEVINEHVHVKYALKQNEKSLMLEPIDTSIVEGELWGSFVKEKDTTN